VISGVPASGERDLYNPLPGFFEFFRIFAGAIETRVPDRRGQQVPGSRSVEPQE
jgi:hypothetical protein